MESLEKVTRFQKLKQNMIFLLVSEDEESYRDKKQSSRQRGVIKIQELSCLF